MLFFLKKSRVLLILCLCVVAMTTTARSFAQTAPADSTPPPATSANATTDQQTASNEQVAVTAEPTIVDTLGVSVPPPAEQPATGDTLVADTTTVAVSEPVSVATEPVPAEPAPTPTEPTTYNGPVTGVVSSATGEPLAGAVVMVDGTSRVAITDSEGRYTITAQTGNTLQLTLPGYKTTEVEVGVGSEVNIQPESDTQVIGTVVVTALGIEREEKALSYNVQSVSGEELTTAKSANFVGSLAGKVAGVQIQSSGGPGGGVKVVSRGMKSLEGNNNILYVVDGIPLHNSQTSSKSEGNYSDPVSSEGIADINPDDIENISMLTGPAAAALYGYEGANGVMLITTKKGSGEKTSITVSNNTMFSNPLMLPKFQKEYLSAPNDMYSWGAKGNVTYDPVDFFNTGFQTTTGVSVQTGVGKHQVYFSAANTTAQGILPNNTYDRYNFALRYTSSFFKDKLTLDASANYIMQNDKNMVSQGMYFNPLPSLYLYPRGETMEAMRNYEHIDVNGLQQQDWKWSSILGSKQNPYWDMYRTNRENKKRRYMFTASLKYNITDYLNVSGRANIDNSYGDNTWKFFASSNNTISGPNGRYRLEKNNYRQTYADIILNFNKKFGHWSVFVNAGGAIKDYREEIALIDANLPKEAKPNMFSLDNALKYITGGGTEDVFKHQVQSVFVNAEVGYRSMVYLTLTGRNDWDSSLAYSGESCSFFYPSVGVALVFSEMFKMPRGFDFAKLRFARTQVGSGIVAAGHYTVFPVGNPYAEMEEGGSTWTITTLAPYVKPKPEMTTSYEVGLDLRFLKGALTFDATWYVSNTYNQTIITPLGNNVKYKTWRMQAGNIRNMGVELALGFNKQWRNGISWNSGLTYSYNKNTIVSLAPKVLVDFDGQPLPGDFLEVIEERNKAEFGSSALVVRHKEGGSMTDLYVQEYSWAKMPNGQLLISEDGKVNANLTVKDGKGVYKNMGPMAAHSYAGWSNTLSYGNENFGNISLGIQIRGRFGGWAISNTQAWMDLYGVSQASADMRKSTVKVMNRGVLAKSYLEAIAEGGGKGMHYVYDATNIRLGEVSLSYTMPRKWFKDVVGITVGFVATNVAMLYCKAPFDPEQTPGAGNNYYNGVDNFMVPSTRNIGFNLKLQF